MSRVWPPAIVKRNRSAAGQVGKHRDATDQALVGQRHLAENVQPLVAPVVRRAIAPPTPLPVIMRVRATFPFVVRAWKMMRDAFVPGSKSMTAYSSVSGR
ncbi:MAG: hypothetical protein IPH43_14915 [Xanthomonadales bacterium]|nr:hypothetical protein [Xanthomonadales bacterium]